MIDTPLAMSSSFFRGAALFAHLRDRVLPELLERARRRGGDLRLWSAGCGTGEEAYSLAVLVADALEASPGSVTARIFATDFDPIAIGVAREGVYSAESVALIPPAVRARHFSAVDGHYAIKRHVRHLVIFGEHDLGRRAAFPNIDLVLCRDVLDNATPEVRHRALQLFAYALDEGGYLVLGASETLDSSGEFFDKRASRLEVYRRGSGRGYMPPPLVQVVAPAQPHLSEVAAPGPRASARRLRRVQRHDPTSSDRLAQVFARLATGVIVVDRARRVRVINSAASRALGVSEDASGRPISDVAPHADPDRVRRLLDSLFEGRGPARLEGLRVTGTAGSPPRQPSITANPLYDNDSAAIDAVVLRLEDVTTIAESRRLVGEPDRAHVTRLPEHPPALPEDREPRALDSEKSDLMTQNERLREANENLATAYARTVEDNERLLSRIAEVETEVADVGALNRELGVAVDELEALNETLAATMEEFRTTNEDVEARRTRLDAVLAGLSDALVVVDRGARAVFFNAAYERLFAAPRSRLRLRDAQGRALPPGELPWQRAARGESFVQEFSADTADGERRFEAIGKTIRVDAEPEDVVVLRDVTHRSAHSVEEELFKLTSHQLRTPLTTLQGSLDRIARLLPSGTDERIKHYAAIAAAQTHQLARLSSDLVDAARLRTGSLEIWRTRVDLADLVRRAVESIRPLAPGQRIEVDVNGEPLEVEGDPGRIEQVVMNLLANAISHAPDSDRIDVRLRRRGVTAELKVQDYGEGISPDLVPHLFTRLAPANAMPHRKGSGLGLGLYLSKEIVEAHGGTISVDSKPGHGATFTVRLPAHREPAA